ncbi:MAG TPA: hypothetical protein VGE98_04635 [Thermoanaerobaculia bacterium]
MIRTHTGRLLLAAAIAGFALLHLLHAFSESLPAPGPPWPAGGSPWNGIFGLTLLALAVGLTLARWAARAALGAAAVFFLTAGIVQVPKLLAAPRDPGPWTTAFELLALCGGALVLAGAMLRERALSPRQRFTAGNLLLTGRLLYAVSLVVFAVQHFLYARFVATLVPAWIPAHLFWAWFIGIAFCAAAASLATGIQARLAATLLGVMFLLWVPILHLPRALAAARSGNEWTSLLVALAMGGCAWVLADASGEARAAPAG